jgi:hypothetical protein
MRMEREREAQRLFDYPLEQGEDTKHTAGIQQAEYAPPCTGDPLVALTPLETNQQ